METKLVVKDQLDEAVAALKAGELVAFPTETVYGLGADGLNPNAVQKIFQAKGRPQDNPLILHIEGVDGLAALTDGQVPVTAQRLAEAFWPGPLTVVVKAREHIPAAVRAGLDTVAVRAPDHSVAQALIRQLGRPIAAPSANMSGRPSPTTADAVWEDLQGRVGFIVDGGPTRVGLESTVVDCTQEPVVLLRPGGLSLEMVASVVGEVREPSGEGPARAPGMKYRHYAPKAPVIFVDGIGPDRAGAVLDRLRRRFANGRPESRHLAVIAPDGFPEVEESLGPDDLSAANRLFSAIRHLDHGNPDAIVIFWESEKGLGLAVKNRILKASSERVQDG